jgi:Predicted transcriptional regulators
MVAKMLTQSKLDERLQLLVRLGLSNNQAKVILALQRLNEPATINIISNVSGVTREKVYSIMPSLQERGLIEKLLVAPVKYKSLQFDRCISVLLKKVVDETEEIKEKAKEMAAKFQTTDEELEQNRNDETIIICKKQIGFQKRMKTFENAQESLDVVYPSVRRSMCLREYGETATKRFKKVLGRGGRIRILVPEADLQESVDFFSANLNHQNFHVRTLNSLAMSLYIIDRKQVTIATSVVNYPTDYSVLCGRNPVLVQLAIGYFESNWEKAMPLNNEKH